MNRLLLCLFAAGIALDVCAVEISPSRRVVPESFTNPPGKRFSIFAGDPERVQKANEVKVQDFQAKIELAKKESSLGQLHGMAERHQALEMNFIVQNKGEKNYTLSFPDAQRYDIMIKDPSGNAVYIWSDDKTFVKEIGKCFVNKNECLTFIPNPEIDLADLMPYLRPGAYKITAILANYPEIHAETDWLIKP
ncbi:MAG: BsuPI-related putative proteinase inhibitor [Verrucomicrobiota bacterium]